MNPVAETLEGTDNSGLEIEFHRGNFAAIFHFVPNGLIDFEIGNPNGERQDIACRKGFRAQFDGLNLHGGVTRPQPVSINHSVGMGLKLVEVSDRVKLRHRLFRLCHDTTESHL